MGDQRRVADVFPGHEEVHENLSEGGVGFEGFDAQVPEVKNVVSQCSYATMNVSQENNSVVLHKNIFFLRPQLQIESARILLVSAARAKTHRPEVFEQVSEFDDQLVALAAHDQFDVFLHRL